MGNVKIMKHSLGARPCSTLTKYAIISILVGVIVGFALKDAKKKDRLKKLHPSVLKFILFASAEDTNTVPPDVTDACKRLINSETEGLADL
jgi:hypothetical protein